MLRLHWPQKSPARTLTEWERRLRQAEVFAVEARTFYEETDSYKRSDIDKIAEYYIIEFYQKLKDWKFSERITDVHFVPEYFTLLLTKNESVQFAESLKVLSWRMPYSHCRHIFNLVHAYIEVRSILKSARDRGDGPVILEAGYVSDRINYAFVE